MSQGVSLLISGSGHFLLSTYDNLSRSEKGPERDVLGCFLQSTMRGSLVEQD